MDKKIKDYLHLNDIYTSYKAMEYTTVVLEKYITALNYDNTLTAISLTLVQNTEKKVNTLKTNAQNCRYTISCISKRDETITLLIVSALHNVTTRDYHIMVPTDSTNDVYLSNGLPR